MLMKLTLVQLALVSRGLFNFQFAYPLGKIALRGSFSRQIWPFYENIVKLGFNDTGVITVIDNSCL